MAGWLTNGVPLVTTLIGGEQLPLDTELASGTPPQSAAINVVQLAAYMNLFATPSSITTVSGTLYYGTINLGILQTLTGIQALVGSTGGTDSWIFALYNSAGVLLANTATAGTTAGTANTWQRVAFTAAFTTTYAGTYFLAAQSNGTTAKFATYNAPSLPLLTGSATGTFGTLPAITPPTTYTAAKAPIALPY